MLERVVSDGKVQPDTPVVLGRLIKDISQEVSAYPSLAAIPPGQSRNVWKPAYVASETLRLRKKDEDSHLPSSRFRRSLELQEAD